MAGCVFCGSSHTALHPKATPCPMPQGEICAPCTKLKQLEARILEAKMALDDLLEQHRETRSEVNLAHDPIIHRVPSEIASSIFQWCLHPVPPDGILSIETEKLVIPLVLGAVCRYWRKIAWRTPQLWSLIAISAGETSDLVIPLEISREWLSRSGQLPLSIGLRVYSKKDNLFRHSDLLDRCDSLFGLVNQHSSRWHMLDIRVHNFLFSRFCADWKEHPLLKSLRLSNIDGYLSKREGFNVHDLLPSVEELCLDSLSLQSLKIAWSRLIHITLVNVLPSDCVEIFRHAPRVKHCEIKRMKDWIQGTDVIVHSHLQHLLLDGYELFVKSFLRSVKFPALENLECITRFLPDHISSMLQRSSCFLKKLTINVPELQQDALISFLRTVPCLQHLEVQVTQSRAPSPDALLRLLTTTSITNLQSQSGQDFLPALQFFAYHRPRSLQEFSWSLVPGIFGRLSNLDNPRRRPLENAVLSFCSQDLRPDLRTYIDKKILPRFLALLDKGIRLSIHTGSAEANSDLIRQSVDYHDRGPDESSDDDDPLLMSD